METDDHIKDGERPTENGLVGDSSSLRALREYALRIAPTDVSVLITGETGTGKECLATLLHRHSLRNKGPLVALNCAAIPDTLLEGELFGYERGAFSGACSAYPGKFKLADGGTLLLDEIGELSLAGQAKILRAIETCEVYRLGGTRPTRFDVRVIAATNRDLLADVEAGRFRADLFYRLAVGRLELPALRDRPEDIAVLATTLVRQLWMGPSGPPPGISRDALELLNTHDWPGNVRELRNVIEIALVTFGGGKIKACDLPPWLSARPVLTAPDRLLAAISDAGGNISQAAKSLKCSRMTLYRHLARVGSPCKVQQVSVGG